MRCAAEGCSRDVMRHASFRRLFARPVAAAALTPLGSHPACPAETPTRAHRTCARRARRTPAGPADRACRAHAPAPARLHSSRQEVIAAHVLGGEYARVAPELAVDPGEFDVRRERRQAQAHPDPPPGSSRIQRVDRREGQHGGGDLGVVVVDEVPRRLRARPDGVHQRTLAALRGGEGAIHHRRGGKPHGRRRPSGPIVRYATAGVATRTTDRPPPGDGAISRLPRRPPAPP
jgi:hypothetical protein